MVETEVVAEFVAGSSERSITLDPMRTLRADPGIARVTEPGIASDNHIEIVTCVIEPFSRRRAPCVAQKRGEIIHVVGSSLGQPDMDEIAGLCRISQAFEKHHPI